MEDEEEECCVPALVDLPSKAIQISAGDSHTAALTEDGHVYIWGKYIYHLLQSRAKKYIKFVCME